MIPFSIDYSQVIALLACMSFFVHGARLDGRSPFVWGGLSLGAWLVVTHFVLGGLVGGVVSQLLLFGALTAFEFRRERVAARRRESAH